MLKEHNSLCPGLYGFGIREYLALKSKQKVICIMKSNCFFLTVKPNKQGICPENCFSYFMFTLCSFKSSRRDLLGAWELYKHYNYLHRINWPLPAKKLDHLQTCKALIMIAIASSEARLQSWNEEFP